MGAMSEPSDRRWSFSLRTLFVVVTVAAVAVGIGVRQLRVMRVRQMERDFPNLTELIRETFPPEQAKQILDGSYRRSPELD
jgi:hypothetical protein